MNFCLHVPQALQKPQKQYWKLGGGGDSVKAGFYFNASKFSQVLDWISMNAKFLAFN